MTQQRDTRVATDTAAAPRAPAPVAPVQRSDRSAAPPAVPGFGRATGGGRDLSRASGDAAQAIAARAGASIVQRQTEGTPASPGQTTTPGQGETNAAAATPESPIATQLRQRYANGITVAMVVPTGYLTDEEAQPPNAHSGDGEGWWNAFRMTWAPANEGSLQGYWRELHEAHPSYPESMSAAAGKQRAQMLSWIWGAHQHQIRERMFANESVRLRVGHFIKGNNDEFGRRATQFAAENQSVALDGGNVAIGRPMVYHSPAELVSLVTQTSQAVRALLGAAPDAERIARVHALAIYSHGTKSWSGGQGRAAAAGMHTREVPAVVSGVEAVLADDVRVMLFACSTGHGNEENTAGLPHHEGEGEGGGGHHRRRRHHRSGGGHHHEEPDPTGGEGGFADAFRDALMRDPRHQGAIVGGHVNSGHCERNLARYFHGEEGISNTPLHVRYPPPWRHDQLVALLGREPTAQDLEHMRLALISFNRRELFIYAEDMSDEGCQRGWTRFVEQNRERVMRELGENPAVDQDDDSGDTADAAGAAPRPGRRRRGSRRQSR